jgi:hypothetical protein
MKNPTKAMALAMVVGLSFTNPTSAVFNPIPISPGAYNADVVVEKEATPRLRVVTTASVDQGTNNGAATWMEIGFDTVNFTNGLPPAGTVIAAVSNANYSFKMPPDYTQPNGILINTIITNGFFTPVTPAPYARLSFAGSGGNGGDVIGVRVKHADGTFEVSAFPCPDWFNGQSNVVFTAGGRMGSTTTMGTQVNVDGTLGLNPRIYFRDMILTNTTSAVTNVELYYVSGAASSHNDILAMSGSATLGGPVQPIDVTGYTYDFIVEATAPKRARVVSQTIVEGTNVWATSQSMDNLTNTATSWYERGFNYNNLGSGPIHPSNAVVLATAALSGLPAAGANITNAGGDRIYTFPASYTANNAIYLSPSNKTATVTLNAPTTASVLSFLGAAGNGDHNLTAVITHADATTETNIVRVFDWFNQTPAYVFGANGRVAVDTAQYNNATNTAFTPRMFGCDVLVSAASPVTQVQLTFTNDTAGRVALFALSGTTDPILPVFVSNPTSLKTNVGFDVTLSVLALANVTISYQWQIGTNGVFVNVVNGPGVSGAQTSTLLLAAVPESADADYRCVATTGAGAVNSGTAHLTVISPLLDVTQPGDAIVAYQPNGGSSPGGEAPAKAIDNTTTKYLNFGNGVSPITIPLGFVVTPSMGRTKVNAMILYTANDGTERDPGNAILEGSDNGGASWTLIYSNNITMPDGRNAANLSLDPIAQNITQIRFANTNGYSAYRWYLTKTKNNSSLMQIGEVDILGVADTSGLPNFNTPPASVVAYDGTSANLFVNVSGTPTPGTFWLKKNGASYTAVVDGGAISGAQTTSLSFSPAVFSQAGEYVCVATNTSGSVTSSPASLTIISTATDVTAPSDTITGFGETTTLYTTTPPAQAIDNFNTLIYRNGGSGINAGAGFPDFAGPVGVVVTPGVGATVLSGLRIYSSTDTGSRDPADYVLEGSNNGGGNYTLISQGALSLPLGRADNLFPFDPTQQPMQEILFANSTGYTSYRLTINNVRDNSNANSMQLGEIELLGVTSVAQPSLTITTSGGDLVITTTVNGTLQSSTNLSTGNWISEGPISGTVNITPNSGEPIKFYRVVVP